MLSETNDLMHLTFKKATAAVLFYLSFQKYMYIL